MKVSEAIDQLQVGDTVWVKGKVLEIDQTNEPLYARFEGLNFWFDKAQEISLTEPQAEKVEVPDFVAEWYEVNKGNLEFNIASAFHRIGRNTHNPQYSIYEWLNDSNNEPMQTLFKMKDGYTVKPKRWVVKRSDGDYVNDYQEATLCVGIGLTPELDVLPPFKFTDRAKAEAVATLVEGTVEEID